METITPETPATTPPQISPRNNFLLVICILTFVGSGFGVLSSIFSFAMADRVSAMNSQYQEQMDNQQTPSFLKSLF